MAESNYDILKIQSGASKKDIRKAYRKFGSQTSFRQGW